MTEKNLSELKYLLKEIAMYKSRLCDLEAYKKKATDRQKVEIDVLKAKITAKMTECLALYDKINEFISSIKDSLLRMIISLRFINSLSWEQIAAHIGGQNTADGIRKIYSRYAQRFLRE